MAVNLSGASNARIDFGDLAAIAGLTQMSIAISCKWSAAANGERIVTQWSTTAGNQAFSCSYKATNNINWILSNGASAYDYVYTTGGNFTSGSWHRILFRWEGNRTGNDAAIHLNGSNQAVTVSIDNSFTTLPNSASAVQVGHQTTETIDGIDGDFAELAIWNRWLDDAEATAVTGIYSPLFFVRGMLLYTTMHNTTSLQDWKGGVTGTNSSGTNSSDHPRIIYPRSRQIFVPSSAAPSSFQSAWARGSNVLITPGVV